MKRAIVIAVAAIAGLAMFKALIGALEPRLVFFPSAGEDQNPASIGIQYQAVRLMTSDGERLVAWQLEPEDPIADVVYFHGNGGNLSVWLPVLAALHAHHVRVLAVDYRGYGLSSGRPSEQGVYRDAEAVAQHAARRRLKSAERPLVFWGRSLGGPIAAAATRVVRPDGLILESSFADKAAVIRATPGAADAQRLRCVPVRDGESAEGLQQSRPRAAWRLAIRSCRSRSGAELYRRLDTPKRFVEVAGADHNDFIDAGRTDYWTPVLEFIAALRTSG